MFDPRTEAHPCPECNAVLSAAVHAAGGAARPSPGDITVCVYCATALQYDEALQPQFLTQEVRATLEPDIARMLTLTQAQLQRAAELRGAH